MTGHDYIPRGAKRFAILPRGAYPLQLHLHLKTLPGARLMALVTEQLEDVFLDFEYDHQSFRILELPDEYWFVVRDPRCPPQTMRYVLEHFQA
ncbi:hypothetical protein [Deinococcus cellulosilyticus]|uniref:Uncharacterized protein n=1 Tax=Deinococcus cellulosilyticus (strain DSM 18568 / NBRC 106333 / KACC 11606 / 5516J-15) TaxID=1223518 RepID=A0A511N5T6_DEIC1|nr:hypothetical protein [Deinococcus cellulosilyticus]GEM48220.1 hypothetical protein DC3_38550 [Deinococcus cellulosilyticus NBRC 106333 = KACC 11606]